MITVALNGVEIIALRDDNPLPAGTVAFEGQFDLQTEQQETLLVDKIRIWVSADQVLEPIPDVLSAPITDNAVEYISATMLEDTHSEYFINFDDGYTNFTHGDRRNALCWTLLQCS